MELLETEKQTGECRKRIISIQKDEEGAVRRTIRKHRPECFPESQGSWEDSYTGKQT